MKQHIAILYADSRFTPWKENVDTSTVKKVHQALSPTYEADIIHMVEPCLALAELLSEYDCVVNLCYGFKNMMQWEVAAWLDEHRIVHLSSSGIVQKLVQNKLQVEALLCGFGLPVARTITSANQIEDRTYIIKPVAGGCHRNISIVRGDELYQKYFLLDPAEWMIQPYIEGREFSVAILPDASGLSFQALYPVEIVPYPKREVYIAGQEYGTTERDFHPVLEPVLHDELIRVALSAHRYTGLEYFSRCDFRVQNNHVYLLDVNAMPNLHPVRSLFPQILRHQNMSIKTLLKRMLARRHFLHQGTGKNSTEGSVYISLN
jgi:D-alanine-D-alanine ligase-like ATP-grasp enzyme